MEGEAPQLVLPTPPNPAAHLQRRLGGSYGGEAFAAVAAAREVSAAPPQRSWSYEGGSFLLPPPVDQTTRQQLDEFEDVIRRMASMTRAPPPYPEGSSSAQCSPKPTREPNAIGIVTESFGEAGTGSLEVAQQRLPMGLPGSVDNLIGHSTVSRSSYLQQTYNSSDVEINSCYPDQMSYSTCAAGAAYTPVSAKAPDPRIRALQESRNSPSISPHSSPRPSPYPSPHSSPNPDSQGSNPSSRRASLTRCHHSSPASVRIHVSAPWERPHTFQTADPASSSIGSINPPTRANFRQLLQKSQLQDEEKREQQQQQLQRYRQQRHNDQLQQQQQSQSFGSDQQEGSAPVSMSSPNSQNPGKVPARLENPTRYHVLQTQCRQPLAASAPGVSATAAPDLTAASVEVKQEPLEDGQSLSAYVLPQSDPGYTSLLPSPRHAGDSVSRFGQYNSKAHNQQQPQFNVLEKALQPIVSSSTAATATAARVDQKGRAAYQQYVHQPNSGLQHAPQLPYPAGAAMATAFSASSLSSAAASIPSDASEVEEVVEQILSIEDSQKNCQHSASLNSAKVINATPGNLCDFLGVGNTTGYNGKAPASFPPAEVKLEPETLLAISKDRQKKDNHNMIERRRRSNINERIKELGTLIPKPLDRAEYYDAVRDIRQHKGQILKATIDYIHRLRADVDKRQEAEKKCTSLTEQNRKLFIRVQELEAKLRNNGIAVEETEIAPNLVSSILQSNIISNNSNLPISTAINGHITSTHNAASPLCTAPQQVGPPAIPCIESKTGVPQVRDNPMLPGSFVDDLLEELTSGNFNFDLMDDDDHNLMSSDPVFSSPLVSPPNSHQSYDEALTPDSMDIAS